MFIFFAGPLEIYQQASQLLLNDPRLPGMPETQGMDVNKQTCL